MKSKNIFFILLGAIIIIQFSFFGLKYFSVVDDNNQFGIYNLRNNNIIENIIKYYKTYNVRPMAAFSDAYIFQWFWNNMYILLVLLLMMHGMNVFLIYKIVDKIDIKLNAFCLTLFALCPVLVEAVYWISASTRIVFSVFLCLLSIYLLLLYFDANSKAKRILLLSGSILLNIICTGYYEQTIALNLFLFAFVLLCIKKLKYIYIPITSTTCIGIWYLHFMLNGEMQERGAIGISNLFEKISFIAERIYTLYNNAYGDFKFSLEFIKDDLIASPVKLFLLSLVIVIFIIYLFRSKFAVCENHFVFRKIALGLLIFVVPFLPFVVLETSNIAVRNLYISTLGLSIIIGTIIDIVLKLIKSEKICNAIKVVLISAFTIPFILSNIEGMNDYRKVNAMDNYVANQIIDKLDENVFKTKKSISINYDDSKLVPYKNISKYIESTIESDWAMSGKLQVVRKNTNIGNIYINSKEKEADVNLYFDDKFNLVNIK